MKRIVVDGTRNVMTNGAVVVTGVSGGIGRACVSRLTSRGFTVIGTIRRDVRLAASHPSVRYVRLDFSEPSTVASAVREVRSVGLPLRAVVNNAGMSRAGALEDLPFEVIREVLEVNLLRPLELTRSLLPDLRAAGGRVINVGSGEGFLATPLNAPYCIAKHALEAFSVSRSLPRVSPSA